MDGTQSSRNAISSLLALIVPLLVYATGFIALHPLAATWGGQSIYSLWFPVAGVRFALLWRWGAGLAPGLALVELAIHLAWGNLARPPLQSATFVASVVAPVLAYGVVVAVVREKDRRQPERIVDSPLPLAAAMAFAPVLAAVSSFPFAWFDRGAELNTFIEVLSAIVVFLVGDVLGVLLLGPPLLSLFGLFRSGGAKRPTRLTFGRGAEAAGAVGLACGVAWVSARAGHGLRLEPLLLAIVWVGLRLGTAAAWLVLAPVAIAALFLLPAGGDPADAMALHMLVASMAVAGYVAGSYSDATLRHLVEISRRDRLLYQADRLKTLRAMSVAIIHEVAQPLSILAIEARNLRELSQAATINRQDLSSAVDLIERKSTGLAELARRLRAFGERGAAEQSPIDLQMLLQDVITLVGPEARSANVMVRLQAPAPAPALIMGVELELKQAFVNLLRNAIAAAPGDEVLVTVRATQADALVEIDNPVRKRRESPGGMGVGLVIARAILQAHGGELNSRERPGGVQHAARIPLKDAKHGV